jgi:Retrotransposon gag protein
MMLPPLPDGPSTIKPEFKMCLRDRAVVWWESLQEDDFDLANWNIVKREFLKMYEPKYLARMTCTNFADLTQKTGESINDYHIFIQMAYK